MSVTSPSRWIPCPAVTSSPPDVLHDTKIPSEDSGTRSSTTYGMPSRAVSSITVSPSTTYSTVNTRRSLHSAVTVTSPSTVTSSPADTGLPSKSQETKIPESEAGTSPMISYGMPS